MQDAQLGAERSSGDAVPRCPDFLPGRRPVHSPAPRVLALSSGPWAQLRVGRAPLGAFCQQQGPLVSQGHREQS